jgi:hypothetical protein
MYYHMGISDIQRLLTFHIFGLWEELADRASLTQMYTRLLEYKYRLKFPPTIPTNKATQYVQFRP